MTDPDHTDDSGTVQPDDMHVAKKGGPADGGVATPKDMHVAGRPVKPTDMHVADVPATPDN